MMKLISDDGNVTEIMTFAPHFNALASQCAP